MEFVEEALELDLAAFGIASEEVVDTVRRVLLGFGGRDVTKLGIHRIDVSATVVDEGQQRIEIGRGLAVESDKQVAVSEDADVRLVEPDIHADPVSVERRDRLELRGSEKDDASMHGWIVLHGYGVSWPCTSEASSSDVGGKLRRYGGESLSTLENTRSCEFSNLLSCAEKAGDKLRERRR